MGYKPKEKDVYMPWSTVTSLWNPKTQAYENVNPAQEDPFEKPSTAARQSKGGAQASQPKMRKLYGQKVDRKRPLLKKARQKKNAGLPADAPSVMFPAIPLALAMRKKEALEKQYPHLTPEGLLSKHRQLVAAEAREERERERERDGLPAQGAVATARPATVPSGRQGNGTAAANKAAPAVAKATPQEDPIGRMVAAAPKRVIRKVTIRASERQRA